jgi:hypothetical protein
MQMHRRRWICAGNCNQNFKSKASIESHMREAHSQTFAELQLPVLIDMCERPENPNEAAECPLCPQEITVSGLEAHLGFHLEELALFVIPINQDDSSEDGGSDRAVGAAENLDRPDSDTLSSLGSFLESRTQHSGTFETNEAFAKFIQSNKNPAEPAVQNWLDTDGENYLITERAGPGDDTLDVVTTLQKPTENLSLIPVTNPKSFLPDFESSGAQAVRLPCFSVPDARNSEFLGREDVLQLIDEQFFPSGEEETATKTRKNMHSFLIYGIGGIGKTQVATEYAHSRMDKFDAIFWLCANERSILAEQFATIAVDLGLEKHGSEAKSLTASCALVQAWLSRPLKSFDDPHTTASWLIVFDALDDFDILEDYLPLSSHGSVLITSRNQVTEMSPYVERAFLLPPFTIQEGVIFLEHLTRGLPIDKESLHVITQKAGGQPLVIKQMADIMVDLQISSKDFLLLYEQVGAEQFTQDQDKSTSLWYDRSLATVWALDRLSVKTLTLLEVMSLLEADRIPEFILIEGCQDVTLSGFPESPAVYYEARAQLLRSSLITYNTERQVLRLHRVVQDTVRAQMNNRQLSSIFQAALALISKVWPFQTLIKRHNVARRAKCAQIFPCVLRLKQVFTEQVVQNKSFEPDYSFAELLNDAGG